MEQISKLLIITGLIFLLLGLIFNLGSKFFNFGKLPGDINIEKKNFKFYFPITTSIIISIILSLIMLVIFWIRK